MPNELAKKGAQPSKQPKFGILWNNSFYDGIVTQRNPLRSNAAHIEAEFYGERTECLIDGLNTEISTKLTVIRRPGSSPYQTGTPDTFPAIDRFYSWHLFNSNTEQIKVIADTASAIYNIPAAGAGNPAPTPLFTKSAGAGKSSFLGVGNTLYFSDGVDTNKVVGSLLSWTALTNYAAGNYIIDTNGNIQVAIGSQTANITNIQIGSGTATLFFSPATQLNIPIGTKITLSGLTTVPALNSTTHAITAIPNGQQVQFSSALTQSFAAETGSATTGNGTSGSPTHPTWAAGLNAITQDAGAQWENQGNQIENWGIAPPATAPSVTQAQTPAIYPLRGTSTWYAPLFVIYDGANLQQLTTTTTSANPPTWSTGTSHPTWETTPGLTTPDNNGSPTNPALWTCLGVPAWVASTSYALGAVILASFTYYITVPETIWVSDPIIPAGGYYETVPVQQAVPTTGIFQCTTAGTSGTSTPPWTNGLGTTTIELSGTGVVWTNMGSASANVWPGATQTLSLDTKILDTSNNIEVVQNFGESSSSSSVTWNTAVGGFTPDNTLSWLNAGPYGTANTGAWIYAYSYVNSVTDTVSTASPESSPISVAAGNLVVLQGIGSSELQVNEIYVWRTVQGGSVLFYLDQIPNPGVGQSWVYTDTTPDTGLDELIEAPIDEFNNPPPVGLTTLVYHLGRIWGAVNNSVYFSAGPDSLVGNGNEAWSPANVFVFPDTVIRLFPSTSGLYVFTTADVYLIQGLGTSTSSFFSCQFLTGVGLSSYDAFAVNGSLVFMYSSDNQILSLDPSAGFSEVGFPIGDQFPTNHFIPTQTQLTWHVSGSADKGLYVSDYNNTWWRMTPTPAPESGTNTWSPKAVVAAGFSAVQSIETSPGIHTLLIGPPAAGGTILKRNSSVYTDNGTAYSAYAIFGSIVIAQPGQLGQIAFFTTDSQKVGNPLTLAIQLDEIAPLSSGYFETLSNYTQDPPQLSPSNSVYAQRFYLSQTEQPALCRHFQIQVNWGTDTVKNELLSFTAFGSFEQES